MKNRFLQLLFGTVLAFGLTSCYSTSVLVGDAQENEPMTKVFTKHNTHLISGLATLGSDLKAQEVVGDYTGYKVNYQHTFVDGLLAFITGNIYTPTTTKIYVPTRLLGGNNYGSFNSNNNITNNKDVVRMTHIVKSGETLQSIANAYQVTVKEIVQWNQLTSIDVPEGTPLIIFMK